jgi:hypothetical protein
MIYFLTAIGYPPGGSSSVHIYTQTIDRTTKNKQYIEQQKKLRTTQKFGRVRAVPHLCEFYLTTEEKARKTSVRVAAGTTKILKYTVNTVDT